MYDCDKKRHSPQAMMHLNARVVGGMDMTVPAAVLKDPGMKDDLQCGCDDAWDCRDERKTE